jgi:hypothetical protein
MSRRTTFAGILVALAGLLAPFGVPATASTASQVHAAKAATAGFTHPPGAAKAGYGLLKDASGVACIAMKGMGAMGVHYANGSLVDSKIQVRHPEAAVYRFTRNGHLRLAALEYLVLRKDWRAAHGANARRQPVRPACVLLAARLALVRQPGRPVQDVEPPGALPRGHLTRVRPPEGRRDPVRSPARLPGAEVTGRVSGVPCLPGADQASSASTSTS